MNIDLNDLYYFCEIVRHGGFAAAERATREPKSKFSRRLAQLEDRLGIRLVERSTRRFRVTEVGRIFPNIAAIWSRRRSRLRLRLPELKTGHPDSCVSVAQLACLRPLHQSSHMDETRLFAPVR